MPGKNQKPSLKKTLLGGVETLRHDVFTTALLIITVIFGIFSLNYLLHGSVFFFTDIGRDFLLLDDLATKKVVLIGARTSLMGVFHGPLWLYLNLPAYLIGHGNPLVVAWFWAICSLLFLISLFWVTNKLFDRKAAAVATVLMSINLIYLQKAFTNPAGTLWLMPLFIFTFLNYWKSAKAKDLIFHLLIGGLIIQFEMLVGVPLLILTGLLCLARWWQTKKFLHLLCFATLLLPLSTFVLFDIRHNWAQVHGLLSYVTDQAGHSPYGWADMAWQRWDTLTRDGLGLFSSQYHRGTHLNKMALVLFIGYFVVTLRKREWWDTKISILAFYYVGAYIFSLMFKSPLQFHYWWPLFPFPLIAFGAMYHRLPSKVFQGLYMFVLVLALGGGFLNGWNAIQYANNSVGKVEDDWQFLTKTFQPVFTGSESELGYFIYTPDVFAYEQKYTMSYLTRQHPEKTVHVYTKEPVTYMVIAPPSGSGLERSEADWKKDKIRLVKTPNQVISGEAGYKIEKYTLSPAEIGVQVDSTINDWIYFR